MILHNLNNAYKVTGIDLNSDDEIAELGKLVADKCVVFIDDVNINEKRLYEIMTSWGDPSRALLHKYVGEKRVSGSHWRELLLNLGYISKAVDDFKEGMSRVSYAKNKKGKPTGIFTNGELDWHSDQQSHHDVQRVIGLMSLFGTANSQTTFLCTASAYESLDTYDKSQVDELWSVWVWDDGKMCEDLIDSQKEIVRYHMAPYPNMECPLLDQTSTGRKGIKFPSHSFSHFRGMSKSESAKYKAHLWEKLNKPEYIYTQNWQDNQIVFMDQNITLHARPTNVKDGDTRTMSRCITYMNKLFTDVENQPKDYIHWDGKVLNHDQFASMVNEQRLEEFNARNS